MIKPLHDHIVLEVIKNEKTTKSGIVLATQESEEKNIGLVTAVGPGLYKDGTYLPMHVKVGDKVLFKSYAAESVTVENKKYLIVKEIDILGIIEE